MHIQFSSSVVSTGGSVKCQWDCQLALNTLLTFLGGVCILRFNSQFKSHTAALLFTGYHLTNLYLVDLQSSPSSFTFLSLGKPPGQECLHLCVCKELYIRISFKQKIYTNLLHHSRTQIASTRLELSIHVSP